MCLLKFYNPIFDFLKKMHPKLQASLYLFRQDLGLAKNTIEEIMTQ